MTTSDQVSSGDSTLEVLLTNMEHGQNSTADNVNTSEIEHSIPAENNSAAVLEDNSLIRLDNEDEESDSPKGSDLTVIGLPKKRLKPKRRPVPFQKLETCQKDKIMLMWFVDDGVADRYINSDDKLATEDAGECCPDLCCPDPVWLLTVPILLRNILKQMQGYLFCMFLTMLKRGL